jgi:phage gp37-like protein
VVYSDSPAMIRQLRALIARVGGQEEPAQTGTGYRCVLHKTAVNALVARRRCRPMTEEERQARVARLQRKAPSSAGRMDEDSTSA